LPQPQSDITFKIGATRADDPSAASFEGEAPEALPLEGATRADDPRAASFEGEAPEALPLEGATRADDPSAASFEGEAPEALPLEGATRAPVIETTGDMASADLSPLRE
jgi:phage terminase large subunit-like protein